LEVEVKCYLRGEGEMLERWGSWWAYVMPILSVRSVRWKIDANHVVKYSSICLL